MSSTQGILSKLEPELNAALRVIVWRFSIYSKGSSIGQHMLNMKYSESMSFSKRILFGLALIGGKYLQDRSTEINAITRRFGDFTIVSYHYNKFQSLLERILGIHHVFDKRQSVRQVSFEFMTRELLWHGFAEFLFFLLPLINIRKIKNTMIRWFSRPALGTRPVVMVAYHECGICGEAPTAPHQAACDHVFCYYCIKGNSLADSSFPCPLCGQPVGEDIQPVECTVALQVK
ncbi:hypothetical protein QZH41_011530 [Actinostola sp. cb2023]|nr:hypothetical protein QZH41_011530 [Actinostola sp. cb2023]